MQPNPSAVERTLTLIEKLEQEIESLENSFEQFAIVDDEISMVHTATIAGLKMAINIVKLHSDWQNLSSDTQLQDNQTCILIMQNDSDEYHVIYDVGLYRKNENGTAWLSLTKPESYIDKSKILALQLIEPPSEALDD